MRFKAKVYFDSLSGFMEEICDELESIGIELGQIGNIEFIENSDADDAKAYAMALHEAVENLRQKV